MEYRNRQLFPDDASAKQGWTRLSINIVGLSIFRSLSQNSQRNLNK